MRADGSTTTAVRGHLADQKAATSCLACSASAPRPGSRASPRGPITSVWPFSATSTGSWSQRSRPDASSRTRRQPRGPRRKVASAVRPTSTPSSGRRYSTIAVASNDPLRASLDVRSIRSSQAHPERLERHSGQGPAGAAQGLLAATAQLVAGSDARSARLSGGRRRRRRSSDRTTRCPLAARAVGWASPTANPAPALATTRHGDEGGDDQRQGRCDGGRLTRRW